MTSTDAHSRTRVLPETKLPSSSTSPSPSSSDTAKINFEEGTTISHFTIEHMVAEGGMGRIYVAKDRILDRRIALKILDGSQWEENFEERFRTEIRALARIDHPNVISIYSAGKLGRTYYFTMPYIEGHSLYELIEQHAPFPFRTCLLVFIETMNALESIHQSRVIHQDINASNIMVDQQGNIHVTDFGISDIRQNIYREKEQNSSHFVGTPEYASPENVIGKGIDYRTDLFSAGVLLYRMITGEYPFTADEPREVLREVRKSPPEPISTHRSSCPSSLRNLCMDLLEKHKTNRPNSARFIHRKAKHLLTGNQWEKTDFEASFFGDLSEKYERSSNLSPLQKCLKEIYSDMIGHDSSKSNG